MTIGEIVDYAEALPHVTRRTPYGPDALALEIYGKQFGLLDLSGKWDFYNLKANPDLSLVLRDRYKGIRQGYHMNKVHWNSIDLCGDVPAKLHEDLLYHAYLQTVACMPRKYRTELFGSAEKFDEAYQSLLKKIYDKVNTI